jgi:hypothetical protein
MLDKNMADQQVENSAEGSSPKRNILIAMDGSKHSEHAFECK